MTMSELLTTRSSIPLGRRRLATVLRQAGDLVRTTDVVSALDVNRSAASKLFDTRFVWRSRLRVVLSDIHRTIVDMLDDPAVGGGGQHVADCVAAYLVHDDRDNATLIDHAARLGNGAVFKRLGFIAEQHAERNLVDSCTDKLTWGYAMLDPALPCTAPISHWRLRIPPGWHGYRDD